MAKNKKRNKKNKLSERVFEKKSQVSTAPKTNPFEFKTNRQKHVVLNRKLKHNVGMPGVSKSKANARRKDTLLREYKQRNQNNTFVDKRIGEFDRGVSVEDKMLARFTVEQSRRHKGTKFNLDEGGDAELTHMGQSLGQIDRFDDPRSDSEDEGPGSGKLAREFTKNVHFGGFANRGGNPDGEKSHKDYIDDLISESKQKKQERQSERSETNDLTTKLDADFKDIVGLLRKASNEKTVKPVLDTYDIAVRELKFDSRGKASDRLKQPEEIAQEEREKLEKLEADRVNRMKGILSEYVKGERSGQHVSADDLNDGFDFGPITKRQPLVYSRDGKLIDTSVASDNAGEKNGEQESGDEKSGEDDSEEDDASQSGDDDDSASEDEQDEESSDSDEGEDLVEEGDDDVVVGDESTDQESPAAKTLRLKAQRDAVMVEAQKELPYTFSMPESYQEFLDLINGHSTVNQLTIVERIIKCHHPSLADTNREKLETLFAVLLQTVNDACSPGNCHDQSGLDLALVDGLVPILFELARFSPKRAAQCMLDVIIEKQEVFQAACDRHSTGRATLPRLDTLIFFKLVVLLFPTSDFRHMVVTPTMLFMSLLLTKGVYNSRRDICVGLFLCSLFREYVALSKRVIPEALCFLRGALCLASARRDDLVHNVMPPFRRNGPLWTLLETQKRNSKKVDIKKISLTMLNEDGPPDAEFRIQVLHTSLTLVHNFAKLHQDQPCYRELYQSILEICRTIGAEKIPKKLQEALKELTSFLISRIEVERPSLKWLVLGDKKPVPLKMFEPRIEDSFDGRKHRNVGPKELLEKQKLLHRYRRELRGAVKQIRGDNRYLAREQLNEQIERDNERKLKTKRIFSELMDQQGYVNGLERKKKMLKLREK